MRGVATSMTRRTGIFFGWCVVGAAFVLAVLGWGIGCYGPPVYLQAIQQNRGWPMALISTAVTAHFVIGAVVVANLPTLQPRSGIPMTTKVGAIFLAVRVLGWASATAPWQLSVSTLFSGAGWAAIGAAAVKRRHLSIVRAHASLCTVHGVQRSAAMPCRSLA
jgi:uncharacterized membrane protein